MHWKGGDNAKVLIVGHHDTVFPVGTVANRKFSREGDIVRGPGIFDMKAGIVQAIYGLSHIREVSQVEILITSDEEVGSYTSRALIEERAKACGAVLVLEPSGNGDALKIARKGVGTFLVDIAGRASHAGLEPEKGINALIELAHQVQAIAAIAKPEVGTTVTPTVATAGTTENVVPAQARITVDVRVNEVSEKGRVEAAFAALTPTVPGANHYCEWLRSIGRQCTSRLQPSCLLLLSALRMKWALTTCRALQLAAVPMATSPLQLVCRRWMVLVRAVVVHTPTPSM